MMWPNDQSIDRSIELTYRHQLFFFLFINLTNDHLTYLYNLRQKKKKTKETEEDEESPVIKKSYCTLNEI